MEQVGHQQRYICPDEGPGPWQHADVNTVRLLIGRKDYEVRPVYARVACSCTLAQQLTGDGCQTCNPEKAVEVARETTKDQQAEIESLQRLPRFLKSYNPALPMGPGMHAQFLLLMDELREYWDE